MSTPVPLTADQESTTRRQTVLPRPDRSARTWANAVGCGAGLAIAEAALRHGEFLVVVAPGMHEATRIEQEIRFFSGDRIPVFHFPDWETLPYDLFSPHPDIVSQRLRTLDWLPRARSGILITPVSTLMQRVVPPDYLAGHVLELEPGQEIGIEGFRQRLERGGYRHVSQVRERGEYAVRGALVDLFPMGRDTPLRVDFLDDEVDSIRTFDPDTQLSETRIDSVHMLPAREFPLTEDGIARFRRAFREAFDSARSSPLYQDVSNGLAPAGLEYYQPLFFDRMATLFEYLPAQRRTLVLTGTDAAVDAMQQQVTERHEQRRHNLERPVLDPDTLFLTPEEFSENLWQGTSVRIEHELSTGPAPWDLPLAPAPTLPIHPRAENPFSELAGFLDDHPGRVLLVAESDGRRESMLERMQAHAIRPRTVAGWHDFLHGDDSLAITTARLEHGLMLHEPALAIIPETALMGERASQRRRGEPVTRDADAIIANLADLDIGAPVVHVDHGVGRYQGLTSLEVGGLQQEFLSLAYAGKDRLYVPVSSLHLISRYTGADPESAPLHRLGGEQWQKVRSRAARRARDVAAELLEIQARRAMREGHAFRIDETDYAEFAEAFPFEETPDQQQAIDSVLADLRAATPMDRVVCGDVGFGKTEVAMRAAFAAVQAGRQVAILVPTTLLAQQHHQNFMDRFANWPVRIESLSRLRSAKQQQVAIDALHAGKVDIIIGTHRLLQKDIHFRDLGLLIVDEEHRFGVRDKERLKKLRAEVDLLTLTATPIPRTLNMSLAGLRDLSIIATPPAHRHAIKTMISEWDDTLIREACERELARGGQVYFVHNEVRSIERIAELVREIMPAANVRVAHGQMRERDLEGVMLDFYHQRFNILLCTTIIESGIDVPSANTMIIHRADRMGMAQLHQLRGRVGRSHHRAYAYLLAPPRSLMTADAQKRLEAVASLEDLGVGFTLASHDLEIRGAGELLGEGQSGEIQEVGFTLYSELLERAVRALRTGETPDTDIGPARATEVELHITALLPADYVPDVHQRLILYKRIASAADPETLDELRVEIIDRFGTLPEAATNLFRIAALRIRCDQLDIARLDAGPDGGILDFRPDPAIDTGSLIDLVQSAPDVYRFDGANRLRFRDAMESSDARFDSVQSLLKAIRPAGSA